MPEAEFNAFRSALQSWFDLNARDLPWRRNRSPYYVLVSEYMLQQTRVEQALPYFERFVRQFPTFQVLADAELDSVLKYWEGLGYYSRARNLHKTAKTIADEHGGILPADEKVVSELPGIGPYTSAAILSMAFGIPLAAVDGNITRLISRHFAIGGDVGLARTRKLILEHARELLDQSNPGIHNEAMIELGATVCRPRQPGCDACPVSTTCTAFALDRVHEFPFKRPRKAVPHHQIVVGIIRDKSGKILINRRSNDAMLGGLWEFPGGKNEPGEPLQETCRREIEEELGVQVQVEGKVSTVNHAYSHFRITLHAFECRLDEGISPETKTGEPVAWVRESELDSYAFPKANLKVIETLKGGVQELS